MWKFLDDVDSDVKNVFFLPSFSFIPLCQENNFIKLDKVPFWAQVSTRTGQVMPSWWRYNRPM